MSLALKCFLHNSLFIQSLSPCSVFSCCYFLFYFLSTLSHKIKQEVLLYLVEFYFLPVLVLFPLFLLTSCVYSKPQFACVFLLGHTVFLHSSEFAFPPVPFLFYLFAFKIFLPAIIKTHFFVSSFPEYYDRNLQICLNT